MYYATVLCVSFQLSLRTHCAPILSNTTSAAVVNTTEEKVPNYCFYNTHTWVKKERKKSGGKVWEKIKRKGNKTSERQETDIVRRLFYGRGRNKAPISETYF
jgi:hypothetical protein